MTRENGRNPAAPAAGSSAAAAERVHRHRIEALLEPGELAGFAELSWSDTFRMLATVWLELIALLAVANLLVGLPIPWAVLVGALVSLGIATRVNALNVVMHEGSHGFLARRRTVNDRLCDATASWWMLHALDDYSPAHRMHHRYLHGEGDPDLDQYELRDGSGELRRLVLEDLIGLTAVRRAQKLMSRSDTSVEGAPAESSRQRRRDLLGRCAAQLIVLGQFVLFQGLATGILFYVVFWLVPVLSVFPVIKRLKAITEHHDPLRHDGEAFRWVARTSMAGRLQDHLVGARMEYHFEHHVFPNLPFRGLRALHARLEARGFFEACPPPTRADMISGGYVRYITRLSSSAPTAAAAPCT